MSIAMATRPIALPLGALRLTQDVIAAGSVLVTAEGELDARTARALVDFVDRVVRGGHSAVILDLGGLAFFGTEGLWALNRVKAACVKRTVPSAVVAGDEVMRLLRICDPHGALHVVATVDDAVARLAAPQGATA